MALAHPSGLPLLDQAVLATVSAARLPPPPEAMRHRDLAMTVIVHFDPDEAQ